VGKRREGIGLLEFRGFDLLNSRYKPKTYKSLRRNFEKKSERAAELFNAFYN